MSRPKKPRPAIQDKRVLAEHFDAPVVTGSLIFDEEDAAALLRLRNATLATIDPRDEDPELAELLLCVLTDFRPVPSKGQYSTPPHKATVSLAMDHMFQAAASKRMLDMLMHASADEAEAFFGRVVKLKRNLEFKDRVAYALLAYRNYMIEHSKEPSKAALKKYMIANPALYRDTIPAEHPWTRVWDAAGLDRLRDT